MTHSRAHYAPPSRGGLVCTHSARTGARRSQRLSWCAPQIGYCRPKARRGAICLSFSRRGPQQPYSQDHGPVPDYLETGRALLAVFLSSVLLAAAPVASQAAESSSHQVTIDRDLLEELLLENAQSRIHILSDKDLLQLFKDVVSAKAPELTEQQVLGKPSPLTNLTKPFRPSTDVEPPDAQQRADEGEQRKSGPSEPRAASDPPNPAPNGSPAPKIRQPEAAEAGPNGIESPTKRQSAPEEKINELPASRAEKSEDEAGQADLTSGLLESSGLRLPSAPDSLGQQRTSPAKTDAGSAKGGLSGLLQAGQALAQAVGNLAVPFAIALQQSELLTPALSLAGLVVVVYTFSSLVMNEEDEEDNGSDDVGTSSNGAVSGEERAAAKDGKQQNEAPTAAGSSFITALLKALQGSGSNNGSSAPPGLQSVGSRLNSLLANLPLPIGNRQAEAVGDAQGVTSQQNADVSERRDRTAEASTSQSSSEEKAEKMEGKELGQRILSNGSRPRPNQDMQYQALRAALREPAKKEQAILWQRGATPPERSADALPQQQKQPAVNQDSGVLWRRKTDAAGRPSGGEAYQEQRAPRMGPASARPTPQAPALLPDRGIAQPGDQRDSLQRQEAIPSLQSQNPNGAGVRQRPVQRQPAPDRPMLSNTDGEMGGPPPGQRPEYIRESSFPPRERRTDRQGFQSKGTWSRLPQSPPPAQMQPPASPEAFKAGRQRTASQLPVQPGESPSGAQRQDRNIWSRKGAGQAESQPVFRPHQADLYESQEEGLQPGSRAVDGSRRETEAIDEAKMAVEEGRQSEPKAYSLQMQADIIQCNQGMVFTKNDGLWHPDLQRLLQEKQPVSAEKPPAPTPLDQQGASLRPDASAKKDPAAPEPPQKNGARIEELQPLPQVGGPEQNQPRQQQTRESIPTDATQGKPMEAERRAMPQQSSPLHLADNRFGTSAASPTAVSPDSSNLRESESMGDSESTQATESPRLRKDAPVSGAADEQRLHQTPETYSAKPFQAKQYEMHTRAVSDGSGSEDEAFPRQRHREAFRRRQLLRRSHQSPRRRL